MTFDGTLTINGLPYWAETHLKHVQTIREKYRIKDLSKRLDLLDKTKKKK